MIKILFGTITLSATLRLATPIIIAAVGAAGGCFGRGTFSCIWIICIYFKGKPDDYQYCYE